MNRRAQSDAFWALPIPRPLDHPAAPKRGRLVPVFFAVAPILFGLLMLVIELGHRNPLAMRVAATCAAVAALFCAPLLVIALIAHRRWQTRVRTGTARAGKITSLRSFEGKGFGYFISVERAAGDQKLWRATVMGRKPDLEWIERSYAVGGDILLVTGKNGAVGLALGELLVDARRTAR